MRKGDKIYLWVTNVRNQYINTTVEKVNMQANELPLLWGSKPATHWHLPSFNYTLVTPPPPPPPSKFSVSNNLHHHQNSIGRSYLSVIKSNRTRSISYGMFRRGFCLHGFNPSRCFAFSETKIHQREQQLFSLFISCRTFFAMSIMMLILNSRYYAQK